MYPPGVERPRWPWAILVAMFVMVGIVVIVVVLALNGTFGGSPGRPVFGVWGGFLLLFLVLWVAFFIVRVAFWSRAVRRRRAGSGYPRRDFAIMIARQRYARGEISREQFDQVMTDLERRRAPP